MVTDELRPGDVIRHVQPGGGGWGDPLERKTDAVERDVRNGKVSAAKAAELHGVVIDKESGRVDEKATRLLRSDLRAAAIEVSMKITDLKTTLVSVPHTEPEFISTGMRKGVTQCLIEVETDEGVTGLGESICRPNAPVIEAAIQSCKPLLVGSDPNNIEAVVNNIRHIGNWHFFERVGNVAVGGIEMALWDIVGKACGKPLYELLGGMVRDRMPIFYYLFRFELDEMERRARKAVEDGWQLIYFQGRPRHPCRHRGRRSRAWGGRKQGRHSNRRQ